MYVDVKPNSFESIVIAWMLENFPHLTSDVVIGGVDFWTNDRFVVHVSPKMHVVKYRLDEIYSFERIEANIADPKYFNLLKELITSQLKRMSLNVR